MKMAALVSPSEGAFNLAALESGCAELDVNVPAIPPLMSKTKYYAS
jgi:hypothetical protein